MILGCGPAGLFAAHAATLGGAEVMIVSKRRKSELYGAQYLQAPIEGISTDADSFKVHFNLNGSFIDYKRKVYGDELPDPEAVTENGFFVPKPAWDMRAAYDRAWEIYYRSIIHHELNSEELQLQLLNAYRPHLVVSTIPKRALCLMPGGHAFSEQSLWAIGDAPERGVFASDFIDLPDNSVTYDGTADTGWHRAARIRGFTSVEWPEGRRPPIDGVVRITKPVQTTCDCWGDKQTPFLASRYGVSMGFVFAGRYGAWHWAGQSHDAYALVRGILG